MKQSAQSNPQRDEQKNITGTTRAPCIAASARRDSVHDNSGARYHTTAHLAEAALGVHAVRVLLAVRADVSLPLANEARGVGQAPVLLFRSGARPQRVLGGPAVEADARRSLVCQRHETTREETGVQNRGRVGVDCRRKDSKFTSKNQRRLLIGVCMCTEW